MTPAPHKLSTLALGAALALGASHLPGCSWLKSPAGQAFEGAMTKIGCVLAPVIARRAGASDALGEEVGTLCDDLAPAVEAELAAMVADRDVKPESLLAHRERHHARRQRLTDHFPGRDPAETIEEGAPLEAALRVLRRQAVAQRPEDGGVEGGPR